MNSFLCAIVTIPLASALIGAVYFLQYKVRSPLKFFLVIVHFLAVVAILSIYLLVFLKHYVPCIWLYPGWFIFIIGSFIFFYSAFIHSASLIPKENFKVVATGPYYYVRHPIYTGGLLGAFGLLLVAPTLEMLVVWCVLFISLVVLLLREERELALRIGDPYKQYCRLTKRLIPKVF